MESKQNKITIPMKTGVWEWSAKGFGFNKYQKQNDQVVENNKGRLELSLQIYGIEFGRTMLQL
ncbi:hypothetical protein A5871_002401 [Enterococcus sp. 2F9_DIV0599]|nr:hypothetical protein A5870_002287 [Enterococcus sp. 2G9_DIV0600]OTO37832.1 hypothetical protein A5871_002401 [Enterococcus sp. 2F9_DIV0599]